MWIERKIKNRILELAKTRPAVVVTGARQVGKTSLLQRIFPSYTHVTLDLPGVAEQAQSDSELFLQTHSAPLFIDEVQYAPHLFRYLKLDIDRHRNERGRFVLSGSQKFLLMREVADSLAGRASVLELEGLSYSEVKGCANGNLWNPEQFLLRGTFPELYASPEIDRREFYRSYLVTYLERDVRALLNVGSLRDFERYIRACALRSGQMLNKSEIARDVGISPSTAGEWLSVLEASNQVYLLEPWFSNRTKSVVKTPKLYWADPGLLTFLVGIHTLEDLLLSPLKGAIWESTVFSEFRKRQAFSAEERELFYFRDRGLETDFLIHRGGRFELFEVKWTENPSPSHAAPLHKVAKILGPENVIRKSIISRAPARYTMNDDVEILPFDAEW